MKMIRPLVNISKIIDNYDTIVVGLRGVISDNFEIKEETITALINMRKVGKRIILVTNSSQRVLDLVNKLEVQGISAKLWHSVVTAGEIMHYKLKAQKGDFGIIGNKYYCLGSDKGLNVFSQLENYHRVSNLAQADFLFVSDVKNFDDVIEDYLPELEHAASLSLPMVCVGNDASSFDNGQICLGSGAIAEQYAVIGGRIITVGKPDANIIAYALDDFQGISKERTLFIGDNLLTDIKAANFIDINSVLISKGVHVNFLGEGYIPDVTKARELSINYEAYPDFIMSNLRW
ncbi:MAG: TIGR01459 family HAD-type hydrolase [Alphaproteobacteria bacterium]|nr:TIGR01459 family HAD-type hydrolase [Alphaproteobacteria bacterium]